MHVVIVEGVPVLECDVIFDVALRVLRDAFRVLQDGLQGANGVGFLHVDRVFLSVYRSA